MMKKRIVGVGLIGKTVMVTAAKNPSLVGIQGLVVDETRNTLKIRTKDDEKTLVKDQATITFENKTIDGKDIIGRIEERIRKS